MKIPVNKNIDVYKDDFFKGLSMRECLCALLTLVSGTAVFFLSDSLFAAGSIPVLRASGFVFVCGFWIFKNLRYAPACLDAQTGSLYPDAFLCVCRGSDREKTSGG